MASAVMDTEKAPLSNDHSMENGLSSSEFALPGSLSSAPGQTSNGIMDMSTLEASLQSVGQDMSLDEAVSRVRQLMKENFELKDTLQCNNVQMKMQCEVLQKVHKEWQSEREAVRVKHGQARQVVVSLQKVIQRQDGTITKLRSCLKQAGLESLVSPEVVSPASFETSNEEIEAEMARRMADKSPMQDDSKLLPKQLQLQVSELSDEKEKLVREAQLAKEAVARLKVVNERLLSEKRDLLLINNQLTAQLHKHKITPTTGEPSLTSPPELTSDLLFSRDFVVINKQSLERPSLEAPREDNKLQAKNVDEMKGPSQNLGGADRSKVSLPVMDAGGTSSNQEDNEDHCKTMNDLVTQLQEERTRTAKVMDKVSQQDAEIHELRERLHNAEKDTEVKLRSTISRVREEHEIKVETLVHQLDTLTRELQQTKDRQASIDDVASLRAQVLSLVNELQEKEEKLEQCKAHEDQINKKCQDLHAKVTYYQGQIESLRSKDDMLIEALHSAIDINERKLNEVTTEKETLEKNLNELKLNFEQLCSDYHELLTQERTPTQVLRGEAQQHADSLMARLMVAEDSLAEKNAELQEVKERLRVLQGDVDTIPVLQAQAEVYKIDFQAEREARERQHAEKEKVLEELRMQQSINQQLQEELNAAINPRLRDMQQRHNAHYVIGNHNILYQGPRGAEVQPQYRQDQFFYNGPAWDGGENGPGEGVDVPPGPGGAEGVVPEPAGAFATRPTGLETETNASTLRAEDNPHVIPGQPENRADISLMMCPKCQMECPDIDSFEVHLAECLD